MKKLMLALVLIGIAITNSYPQKSKFYGSGSAEINISYASIHCFDNSEGSLIRFAPVLNLQGLANYDLSNTVGFFTGCGIQNVGFIYEPPDDHVTMKYRSYTLGIPLGFKFGKLDYMFLFGGYEIEFPFHYKEKKFEMESKEVFTEWFSARVTPVQHSIMAGMQFPYGIVLKFKYYVTNFLNKDFVEYIDAEAFKPYENLNSNIFLVSVSWNLFTDFKAYKHRDYYEKTLSWDEQPLVVTNRPVSNTEKH
jgi:hypothetical protein